MDNEFEFGAYSDDVLYSLRETGFANEYFNMNNTQRLKFLNEILQILGYYGAYEINEEEDL